MKVISLVDIMQHGVNICWASYSSRDGSACNNQLGYSQEAAQLAFAREMR